LKKTNKELEISGIGSKDQNEILTM